MAVKKMGKADYSRIYLQDAVLEKKKFVVFDTETTGLTDQDEIIQFSAISVNFENWSVNGTESFYINIGKPLPDMIIQLTGITDATLNEKGITREEASSRVSTFLKDAVICGHNLQFDIKKVQHLFDVTGNSFNIGGLKVVDTCTLAKKYIPKEKFGNHKLGTLTNGLHLEDGLSFHNAIDDVIATMRLCHALYKTYINEYAEDATFVKEDPEINGSNHNEEGKLIKTALPYIPSIPLNDISKETVRLLRLARWKKSQTMDRIYINIMTKSGVGKIYFDMPSGQYKDVDGNLVANINLCALQTAICDMLWDNGFSGYDDFNAEIQC